MNNNELEIKIIFRYIQDKPDILDNSPEIQDKPDIQDISDNSPDIQDKPYGSLLQDKLDYLKINWINYRKYKINQINSLDTQ